MSASLEDLRRREAEAALHAGSEFQRHEPHIEAVQILNVDEMNQIREKTISVADKVHAELLRGNIEKTQEAQREDHARLGILVPASPLEYQSAEDAAHEKLSNSKRRKRERRQQDNLQKATNAQYPRATSQTLPMRKEIKRLNRLDEKGHRHPQTEKVDWKSVAGDDIFNADLFEPSFDRKTDVTINIEDIRAKLQLAEKILPGMRASARSLTVSEAAEMTLLEQTAEAARKALCTIVGSHGIDFKTGDKLTGAGRDGLNLVDVCNRDKGKAIARYRELISNRKNLLAEETFRRLKATEAFTAMQGERMAEQDRVLLEGRTHALTKTNDGVDNSYLFKMQCSGIPFVDVESAKRYIDLQHGMDTSDQLAAHPEFKEPTAKMFAEYSTLERYAQEHRKNILIAEEVTKNGDMPADARLDMLYRLENSPDYLVAQRRIAQLTDAMKYLLSADAIASREAVQLLTEEYNITVEQIRTEKWNALLANPDEHPEFVSERLLWHRRTYLDNPSNLIHQQKDPFLNEAGTAIDERIFTALAPGGFEVKERRNPSDALEPLTERDAINMREFQNFLNDMQSKDRARIGDRLDAAMNEALSFVPTPEMFEGTNFLVNLDKLRVTVQRTLVITNIKKDFPWYFEERQGFYEKMDRIATLHSAASELMLAVTSTYGIDTQNGKLRPIDMGRPEAIASGNEKLPGAMTKFVETLRRYNANEPMNDDSSE